MEILVSRPDKKPFRSSQLETVEKFLGHILGGSGLAYIPSPQQVPFIARATIENPQQYLSDKKMSLVRKIEDGLTAMGYSLDYPPWVKPYWNRVWLRYVTSQ